MGIEMGKRKGIAEEATVWDGKELYISHGFCEHWKGGMLDVRGEAMRHNAGQKVMEGVEEANWRVNLLPYHPESMGNTQQTHKEATTWRPTAQIINSRQKPTNNMNYVKISFPFTSTLLSRTPTKQDPVVGGRRKSKQQKGIAKEKTTVLSQVTDET